MYSFPNLEPINCSMFSSNCCFLTCIQISQEAGQVVTSHLLKNFPQFVLMHTVKGLGIVNKAEANVSMELSCFVNDPMDVDNLTSDSSAFYKSSLNVWKFTVHVLLKPGIWSLQDMPRLWQGHRTREEPARQLFPSGSPWGPSLSPFSFCLTVIVLSTKSWKCNM